MLALDVLYTALTTIGIMILLQFASFGIARILRPPQPTIIYRDVIVPQTAPPPQALTQLPPQEIKLPEYEPRQQASDSIRLDPELPPGIKETRPIGT